MIARGRPCSTVSDDGMLGDQGVGRGETDGGGGLDGIGADFKKGVPYWVEAALRHSQDLPQAEREVALTHIRNAPAEVRTPLRDKVEEVFG